VQAVVNITITCPPKLIRNLSEGRELRWQSLVILRQIEVFSSYPLVRSVWLTNPRCRFIVIATMSTSPETSDGKESINDISKRFQKERDLVNEQADNAVFAEYAKRDGKIKPFSDALNKEFLAAKAKSDQAYVDASRMESSAAKAHTDKADREFKTEDDEARARFKAATDGFYVECETGIAGIRALQKELIAGINARQDKALEEARPK